MYHNDYCTANDQDFKVPLLNSLNMKFNRAELTTICYLVNCEENTRFSGAVSVVVFAVAFSQIKQVVQLVRLSCVHSLISLLDALDNVQGRSLYVPICGRTRFPLLAV